MTNLIVLEEAHNLLLAKQLGTTESVLESSIRMIRQYGLGYVFVDQSASLLSKVAFANSYATIALSQKLRSDIQAMAVAMNLTDEQKQALSTLAIGTAVVRLADEHPEPFLIRIPLFPIREGSVSDDAIRARMAAHSGRSASDMSAHSPPTAIPAVPPADRKTEDSREDMNTHPPSPGEALTQLPAGASSSASVPEPPRQNLSREEIRFLADVAARPLSTTVPRYRRLNLSRRRGNAIRKSLVAARLVEAVPIATRSGQVVLYQLSELGRIVCNRQGIDPGARPKESLEHRFWVMKTAVHFEKRGYEVRREHPIKGNGAIDMLAEKPGERVAVEVETGKSDIKANVANALGADFDRVILVATSPSAVTACQKAIEGIERADLPPVELLTWLDVS